MRNRLALIMAVLTLGLWGNARAEDAKPAADYPLDTCVVSGEKLGEMGAPHEMQYQGQTIWLCCKNCVKKFNKEPQKYLAKLDAARAAAAKPAENAQTNQSAQTPAAAEAK